MNPGNCIIAPSILSVDLGRLNEEITTIESDADWLQIDVMDGHFVPNLSFGAPVVKCIKTALPLDVHLMVTNPAERIREFLDLRVAHVTFHAEAVPDPDDQYALIKAIRESGATAGIALRPGTPLHEIEGIIFDVDLVLIMTVEPGFGGQAFMPAMLEKVRALRTGHPELMIQVDGGINEKTAAQCRNAGANNLVAGSFIFKAANRAAAIRSLRGKA